MFCENLLERYFSQIVFRRKSWKISGSFIWHPYQKYLPYVYPFESPPWASLLPPYGGEMASINVYQTWSVSGSQDRIWHSQWNAITGTENIRPGNYKPFLLFLFDVSMRKHSHTHPHMCMLLVKVHTEYNPNICFRIGL